MRRAFRSLRHNNYRLFIMGQFVSIIGSWMQNVAQNWLLYELTNSPAYLGILGFAAGAPALILSPLAGAFADHHQRRTIVIVTQSLFTVCALGLAVLTFAGAVQVWHILGFALISAAIDCFDIPARQALMSELVAKEDLMNAIAINASAFNLARLFGPAIAG